MIEAKHLSLINRVGSELIDINLAVGKGEIVAISGPNGSGKSLLLRALADPDISHEGEVVIGHFKASSDPDKLKHIVGYLPHPVKLEMHLTGYEYLDLIGSFYRLSPKQRSQKILALAAEFNAKEYLYNLLERVGPAFHQQIAVMASLIHQPHVLLWDEPTAEMDYFSQRATMTALKGFVKNGGSAVVSSNNLDFLESIADRHLILWNGQIVLDGSLSQITRQLHLEIKSLAAVFEKLAKG